jgi:site-specific DNA recombinase
MRDRMPELRAKQAGLQGSLASLEAQLVDRDTYLKLAENLEGFLARLRATADTATIESRQQVLRSVVKEVLVGPERVIIRHSIPGVDHPFRPPSYRLRLRCHGRALRGAGHLLGDHPALEHPHPQPRPDQLQHLPVRHPLGKVA